MTRVSGNNIPAAPNNEVIFWVFETFEMLDQHFETGIH